MAILTAKKVWRRAPAKVKLTIKLSGLTLEEQANVLAFALTLRARYRSWEAFARALGVKQLAAFRTCTGLQEPCAGLALRVARLAGVTVEQVLCRARGLSLSVWARERLLAASNDAENPK